MALGFQAANVDAMAALTGLTHDIFVGSVVDAVKYASPAAALFQDAQPGEYRLEGQAMKFAVDLRFKRSAMATDGKIPSFVGMDAVQGSITPVRRYDSVAVDNLVEKQASGPGSFENLADRLFDHLWKSWEFMECQHAIGASSGLLAQIASRTSSTVVVLDDGYGNSGTDPLLHLSEGMQIAWYDVSAVGIGGAANISSINYSTKAVTVDSATTWEPSAQPADNDLVYIATINDSTSAHFISERGLAPNGLGTIVDPAAASTTVHGISQSTYQRWKPYRVASVTCDHIEFAEHWQQLSQKRGFPVSAATDVVLTYPSVVAQVARSLLGYQQQAYTGGNLMGGYSGVTVNGIPFIEDGKFYHNVAMTCPKQFLFRVNLGGDADFWAEDGSKWARTEGFDGKDCYVVDYLNFFSPNRGAFGALTTIVTDVTDTDWLPIPNY